MKSFIIILFLLACFIITCGILSIVYLEKENKIKISINKMDFKQLVISIIIAVIIGFIIQKVNQDKIIKGLTIYYNNIAYLFIAISMLLIVEIIFYNNSKYKVASKYSCIFTYIIYSLILTLVSINKIDINQILCSISWLLLFYVFKLCENITYKSKDNFNERSEEPINDRSKLYKQRLTELKHIETYIKDNSKDNNCTISICADWGEGKTSFINALKRGSEDNKDYVIFIQPMIMDSRQSLIDYFFYQMKSIMDKKSIYTGKGSSIDKYVDSLMNIIGKDNKKIFDNLFYNDQVNKNDYREQKENLQKDIDILLNLNSSNNKNIKILIDDFDRVEESVMYHILAFIKEIASFRGCTVIFLMDYKKIKNNTITYEYLDKFISKKFELKKIHKEEIIKYYLDNKIYFNFEKEDNEIIKEQYRYFKENIYKELDKVEDYIKERIEKIIKELEDDKSKGSDKMLSENDKIKKNEEELETIKGYIKIYTDLSSNPRRLKKLFTEIEYTCKLIYNRYNDNSIDDIKSNYNLVNCNEIILKMSLLKIFFEKEYDDLLNKLDIEEYIKIRKDIVKVLFEKEDKIYFNEMQNKMQATIYKFINENFVRANSSLESIVEIRTKNKEILQLLDEERIINSYEAYEIVDILQAIYSESNNNDIIEKRLSVLENCMEAMIDRDKIKFSDVLKVILEYNSRAYYNEYIKRVNQILTHIIFKLIEKQYTFNDIQDRQQVINLGKDFRTNIVFKHKSSILSTLEMVLDKEKMKEFDFRNKNLYDEDNIKKINKYATNLLGISNDKDISKETELLERWVKECIDRFNNKNINEIYKNRIKYIHEEALELIETIKLIDELIEKISKIEICYKYDISNRNIPYRLDELQDEILLLRKQLEDNNELTNIKGIYELFDRITAQIYITSLQLEEYVNKECLENIDYIFSMLDKEYNTEYLDLSYWSYCALRITYINTISKKDNEVGKI